jgi:protein-glutamine gamma-glutamyltransferase
MILIAGRPFQQSDKWPTSTTEKIILKRMQDDPNVYAYQSIGELSFELTLRKNIIESAKAMSKGKSRFASFATSRCNPRFWILTNAGGFWLRYNVKPSDAIKDIFINSALYRFDCSTAKVIIYYHATLNSIGENLFNQLFRNIYLYGWHFDPDLGIKAFYSNGHFIPGDILYIKNPDFDPKTPWWRGENAVVLEDGKFFGHGLGIRSIDEMIQFLNKKRRPGSNQSAYLTNVITRPDFRRLADLSMLPNRVSNIKQQNVIIHHNQSSISFATYLYILMSSTFR